MKSIVFKWVGLVCVLISFLLITSCENVYTFPKGKPSDPITGNVIKDTAKVAAHFRHYDSIRLDKINPFDPELLPRYEIVSIDEVLKMFHEGKVGKAKYMAIRHGKIFNDASDSLSTYLYMLDSNYQPVKNSPTYILNDMQRCPHNCPDGADNISL